MFLSSTVVDGRFMLRICVIVHRTHRDRVDECVELIRDSVRLIGRGLIQSSGFSPASAMRTIRGRKRATTSTSSVWAPITSLMSL